MSLLSWLPAVGGLASAWAGYQGAKAQQSAADQNYAAQQAAFEYEKAKQAPLVQGGQALIEQLGTADDPFSPFVDRARQSAAQAGGIGQSYLANTQPYQQAGLRGVSGIQSLADTATIADTLGQAQEFQNPFLEATYGRGLRDINRAADKTGRQNAILAAQRGSSLSGQAARRAGAVERQRAEAIGDLAAQTGSQAYTFGLDQARRQRAEQLGLGQTLSQLGGTGLSQATTAQNLAGSAQTAGIQAPFSPLSAYGQVVGVAPALSAPQVQAPINPLQAGIGAGLAGYSSLVNPEGG